MAERSKPGQAKKRQLKKTETVRQRVERVGTEEPKKRTVKKAASKIWIPLRIAGQFIAKVLSPFAFVLKPFKTKPVRFIGRILAAIFLFKFFRQAWTELRQVQWPTKRETVRLTIAVFVFSLLFGTIVAATDYGLDKVFKKVFID